MVLDNPCALLAALTILLAIQLRSIGLSLSDCGIILSSLVCIDGIEIQRRAKVLNYTKSLACALVSAAERQ